MNAATKQPCGDPGCTICKPKPAPRAALSQPSAGEQARQHLEACAARARAERTEYMSSGILSESITKTVRTVRLENPRLSLADAQSEAMRRRTVAREALPPLEHRIVNGHLRLSAPIDTKHAQDDAAAKRAQPAAPPRSANEWNDNHAHGSAYDEIDKSIARAVRGNDKKAIAAHLRKRLAELEGGDVGENRERRNHANVDPLR